MVVAVLLHLIHLNLNPKLAFGPPNLLIGYHEIPELPYVFHGFQIGDKLDTG